MPENLGLDVPAGKIVRVIIAPEDENHKPAKLDGPVVAVLLSDPGTAEVKVGGPMGLMVDVKLPDIEGSLAAVELDGDNDLSPDKREVITTILNLRRLGEVPGKAVTLGAKPENVSFVAADQFGVFPT